MNPRAPLSSQLHFTAILLLDRPGLYKRMKGNFNSQFRTMELPPQTTARVRGQRVCEVCDFVMGFV